MENNERLEEALGLIGKGNQHEEENDYWQASQCFCDAMSLLFQLAVEMTPETPEDEKIGELYQTQCREYLHRARKALIEALSNEDTSDLTDQDGDPKFITLSNEEAKERVQLFSTLFSKELELGLEDEDIVLPAVEELTEQQSSLEERLKSLNSSLIPSLKTEDERMKDINQGLKGLGLNLYSHADQPRPDLDIPVSKEDQIANIIAQAKDEARFDDLHGKKEVDYDEDGVTLSDEEDDLSDDDDNEEDEINLDDDSFIPKLLNKKAIRKCVVNAQVKLAQLVALLDTEGTASTKNNESKDDDAEDDGGKNEEDEEIADDEKTPAEKVEFDLAQARTLLLKANKNLSKAVSAWEIEQ